MKPFVDVPQGLVVGSPRRGGPFWCFLEGFPAARYLVKPNYQNNKVFC